VATELITVRTGEATVRLSGSPGELLRYLFGRPTAAQVDVTGAANVVAIAHGTHFGMRGLRMLRGGCGATDLHRVVATRARLG
jgi:hypothetical protein